MIAYTPDVRIPVVIGEITFWISPITVVQKNRIFECTKMEAGTQVMDRVAAALLLIKFSVREVEGITNIDGTPYVLQFDNEGNLTDGCADVLFQLDTSKKLVDAASVILNKIEDFEQEGVKLDLKRAKIVSKKN